MIWIKTLKSKLEQAYRLLLVNSVARYNRSVLIVEYPKSGGTWLGQLISEYLDIPFPRNRFPGLKRSVLHSHYLPKMKIPKMDKIVYLVRDGRDVAISMYYHQLLWNEKNRLNPKDVIYHRGQTGFDDFEDVKGNLSDYLQYIYEEKPSKLQQFTYMGNWYEFNKAWLEQMKVQDNIYFITYEELLRDTRTSMRKLLKDFLEVEPIDEERLQKVVDKYSFESQSNRKKGEENKNSFLRKGISGDWKNYFGEKEKKAFKRYTGNLLVELNYERDLEW